MSSDLYNTELTERMSALEPTDRIEPGVWTGFVRGTGQSARRAMLRSASGIDLLGAVGPIVQDAFTGGTEAQDRYFKEHDEVYGRAMEHLTPKPDEIGIAGQITGELLGTLPFLLLAPGPTIGAMGVGETEELMRRGVPLSTAAKVGAVQAASMGLGIWVPILGRTLAQRMLVGGAGFNVVQGSIERAASRDILEKYPDIAAGYAPLDPAYLTLDILLGLAFGGMAHVHPGMRAEGAKLQDRFTEWLRDAPEGTREALAVMRQAQHMAADSLPGRPVEPQDASFHVDRVRQALEQVARNEPVDVSNLPEARTEPLPEVQAERAENLQEIVRAAEEVRKDEGLPTAPEDPVAPRRLAPEDLTLVPYGEQARALGQAVENRLLDLRLTEQEAKANAAVWEAFFETTSRKYGVRVADLLETYGIDVRRMSRADIEQLQPGVLTQGQAPSARAPKNTPEYVRRTVSSDNVDAEDQMHRGPTAAVEGGELIAYHLTDDSRYIREALTKGTSLIEGRGADKYGDLGRGFYVSGIPRFWGGRSTGKWDFIKRLTPAERSKIADELEKDPTITGEHRGYLSDSELKLAKTYIARFREGKDQYAEMLANQPFNMNIARRDLLGPLGIEPGTPPKSVEIRLRGNFAELKRNITDAEAEALRALGYDGAFTPMSMGTTAQMVVWNNAAMRIAGESPLLFQSEARSQIVQTAKKMQERWYSELERQITAANIKAAPAKGWKDYLRGLMGKGQVKADELKWTGIEEWLDLHDGRVAKDEVVKFLKENGVKIEETLYGAAGERTVGDAAIADDVAILQREGFDVEVNQEDQSVVAFVDRKTTDIVTASELQQYASDARTEPEPDAAEVQGLERAAAAARAIETYWSGERPSAGQRTPDDIQIRADAQALENEGFNIQRDLAAAQAAMPGEGHGWLVMHPDGTTFFGLDDITDLEQGANLPTMMRGRVQRVLEYLNEDAPEGWDTAEPGERPTKFGQYQLSGGRNYRELTLRLPMVEGRLPVGYRVLETKDPSGRNAHDDALDAMTKDFRAWTRERGYQEQSADELRVNLEEEGVNTDAISDPGRMRQIREDIGRLKIFEKNWDAEIERARGGARWVLEGPNKVGTLIHNAGTRQEAIDAAMQMMKRSGDYDRTVFSEGHFPEPGVLAHVRFNERTDTEGKRVLFIEEVQSDWAKKVRKSRQAQVEALMKARGLDEEAADKLVAKDAGFYHETEKWLVSYRAPDGTRVDLGWGISPEDARAQMDPGWAKILKEDAIQVTREPGERAGGAPPGPFVGKTEQWVALVMKRMIRWAAEGGFERVAWTTGLQQVERYTGALRKAVDSIEWTKTDKGVQLVGYKGTARQAEIAPSVNRAARDAMERNDNLGFDDTNQAMHAVWTHADWDTRWEIDPQDRVSIRSYIIARREAMHTTAKNKVVDTTQREDELSDAIGKAMADQIKNDPNPSGTIEGPNIRIDDTGMAGFYERILPAITKKLGAKPTKVAIDTNAVADTEVLVRPVPESRDMPQMEEFDRTATDLFGGMERFSDGEPPMYAETTLSVDGRSTPVMLALDPSGLHILEPSGEFEFLAPADQLRRSHFKAQNDALERVDQLWYSGALWNHLELIQGEVKRDVKASPQPGFDITPELREKALSGMTLFQKGTRGMIKIGPETVIGLFEAADKSTFLHESSHLFLQVTQDLARRGGAPLQALDDWSALSRWLGMEGGELTRAHQEKFATAFERYMAEGKAPSEELRSVFQQFRDWLLGIYKSLANIADELPDEIRGVMDRMLVSQRQDPTPKAEGPPRAEAEPPPPPGEATPAGRPEARSGPDADWRESMRAEGLGEEERAPAPRLPLTNPKIAGTVDMMLAAELGWEQIGGRRADASVSTTSGQPNFTSWIPKSELWPGRPAKHMNEAGVRRAVEKARAGERLGKAEAATVDYLVDLANKRLADIDELGGPEEWNATAREVAAEGIEPSTENVQDADIVARAAEIDELGVERAAQRYENDDAAFMAEMRRIVGSRKERQAKPGEGAPEGGQEGAGEAQGAEGAAQSDPLRDAALRYVEANPEQLISIGRDPDGNPVLKTLRQYLDDELLAAKDAREDIRLIEAAASCLYGRG